MTKTFSFGLQTKVNFLCILMFLSSVDSLFLPNWIYGFQLGIEMLNYCNQLCIMKQPNFASLVAEDNFGQTSD